MRHARPEDLVHVREVAVHRGASHARRLRDGGDRRSRRPDAEVLLDRGCCDALSRAVDQCEALRHPVRAGLVHVTTLFWQLDVSPIEGSGYTGVTATCEPSHGPSPPWRGSER